MIFNNKRKLWLTSLTILLAVLANGCYYDKEELLYPGSNAPTDCAGAPASFSADVLPLIKAKCAVPGCHDATASGGYTFQNYNQVSSAKEAINMQALIQKTMPPDGPLSAAEINTL